MVNTRDYYQPRMIAAARQVLLELAELFKDERGKIVFVGGTACALLFPQENDLHEGTIDVDIALDTAALAECGTGTLEEKLLCANYQPDGLKANEAMRPIKSYRWFRAVSASEDSPAVEVAIDLLAGEYDDSLRHTNAREIQGLHASVLHGLDLAFLDPRLVPLASTLPDGTYCKAEVQVCSAASLLAMKGIAIVDRLHGGDKDAFDIDYILRRFEGGPDALARVFQTDIYRHHGLVQEGLAGVAQAFSALDAVGPTSIATENRYPEPEERAIVQQGAYRRVQALLNLLKIKPAAASG